MKHKTSKYIAATIIVIGLLFIYFIPNTFKTEFQKLFDRAEVVVLVDNIQLVGERRMYGTIVGIVNKNKISIQYKVGDRALIGTLTKPTKIECKVVTPQAVILFINSADNDRLNDASNKWYFNNGKLGNGYTFEYVKGMFE